MMTTALRKFPEGTPEFTSHTVVASYVQGIVKDHDLEQHIRFRTLVKNAEKKDGKWELTIANNVDQPDGFQSTEVLLYDIISILRHVLTSSRNSMQSWWRPDTTMPLECPISQVCEIGKLNGLLGSSIRRVTECPRSSKTRMSF